MTHFFENFNFANNFWKWVLKLCYITWVFQVTRLESKPLSLWLWPSLILVIIEGICVIQIGHGFCFALFFVFPKYSLINIWSLNQYVFRFFLMLFPPANCFMRSEHGVYWKDTLFITKDQRPKISFLNKNNEFAHFYALCCLRCVYLHLKTCFLSLRCVKVQENISFDKIRLKSCDLVLNTMRVYVNKI